MVSQRSPIKTALVLALALFFFTINYYALLSATVESAYPFVYASLAVFVLFGWVLDWKCRRESSIVVRSSSLSFLVLWFAFSFLLFVSELLSNEILEFPVFLFFVPSLAFFLLPGSALSLQDVELSVILASAPFALIAFIFSLMGHRFDSNSIALIVLSGGVALMAYGSVFLNKKAHWPYYWLSQVALAAYAFTLLGVQSRTALLSFGIVYAVNCALDVTWIRVLPKYRARWMVLYYACVLSLIPVYLALKGLPSFVAGKWGGDISSHRFTIWEITLDNAKWLGQGYHFFPRHGLLGPHNFLFGVLAYVGILGVAVVVALLVKITVDVLLAWLHNRPLSDKKVLRAHISPVLGDPDSTGVVLSPLRELLLFGLLFVVAGQFEASFQYPAYRVLNLMCFIALGYFYFPQSPTPTVERSVAPSETPERFGRARGAYGLLLVLALIALLSVSLSKGDGNVLELLKRLLR